MNSIRHLVLAIVCTLGIASCDNTTETQPGTTTHTVFLSAPASVDFGSVLLGTNRDTTIVLSNTGNTTLTIKRDACRPACFAVTRSVDTIAAGGTLSVRIRYTPSDTLGNLGYDSLYYGDSMRSATIVLRGKGYLPVSSGSSETVYLGSTYGQLRRSTDGGVTWGSVAFNSSSTVWSMTSDGQILYVCAGNPIQYSSNDGASWNGHLPKLHPIFTTLAALNGKLYAGSAGSGAFRSTDGGATWTTYSSIGQDIGSFCSAASVLYIATHDRGIFRSTDNGETFVACNTGFATIDVNTVLSMGTALFAATADGVYKSTDGGDHWTKASSGVTLPTQHMATNGKTLVCVGSDGIYTSNDAAASWHKSYSGAITSLFIIGSGNSFLCGYDRGVLRTSEPASTWIKIADPLVSDIGCGTFK